MAFQIPEDIRSAMAQTPCAVMFARGICAVPNCLYNHDKRNFFCTEERNCGRCKSSRCFFKHRKDTNGVPTNHPDRVPKRNNNLARPRADEFDDGPAFTTHVAFSVQPALPSAPNPPITRPQASSTDNVRLAHPKIPETAPRKAPSAQNAANSNMISLDTLRDLEQIEPPEVAQLPETSSSKAATRPPGPKPRAPFARRYGPKPFMIASCPDPVASDKGERDLIQVFKAPLLSPLPLNEIERRSLLDSSLKMLNHKKDYMKRFAAKLLSEPRPLSHLVDISQALLESQADEDAYSLTLFRTRCIPLMRILSHDYFQSNAQTKAYAKKIIDEMFPAPIYGIYLISRGIACFQEQYTLAENSKIDRVTIYTLMTHFFITFARLSKEISGVSTASPVAYWVISFVEDIKDSWYPEEPDKERAFEAITEILSLYNIGQYFHERLYHKGFVESPMRLPCIHSKEGKCDGKETDTCFFSHELQALVGNHIDKGGHRSESMEQWLQLGSQQSVLSLTSLTEYWCKALELFSSGHKGFIVDALNTPEIRPRISQILNLPSGDTAELEYDAVIPFLRIMSDEALEDFAKSNTKVAEIAAHCAQSGTIFCVWSEYVKMGLEKEPGSPRSLEMTGLLAGFARFVISFNPIQSIEPTARKAMMTLSTIVAENHEEGAAIMSHAHEIAERLGFSIHRDLIMGTIDIVDRDLPSVEGDILFEGPLVWSDDEDVAVTM
ncbi:hypothetical protein DRE_04166 [Drechslerella stenobrocha 248]|uniref:C3H1-type domain-containing protein n=1 Tax=Drechslerella stenobrocha 248 TaxID=1043628 RepID=W7HTH5_9PEZI|nr:hypothetical protein DRE_04166 [Drechslerella stenobrocha 248]